MKMLSCIVGTLVALFVTEASAQMVKAQTGWETSWSAKSENACYKCCRRWQTGWVGRGDGWRYAHKSA